MLRTLRCCNQGSQWLLSQCYIAFYYSSKHTEGRKYATIQNPKPQQRYQSHVTKITETPQTDASSLPPPSLLALKPLYRPSAYSHKFASLVYRYDEVNSRYSLTPIETSPSLERSKPSIVAIRVVSGSSVRLKAPKKKL